MTRTEETKALRKELERVQEALTISERHCRSLELQLRQSQKMQALGTLAGGIAHDFNNLLTSIGGNAELALSGQPNDEVRESLDEIKRAYLRAKELVRRILVFSRRQEDERKQIDLRPIVEDAISLIQVTLPKTIKIGVRSTSDLPTICGDANQIHQVIMNLVTNAAQAMRDRGGRIVLKMDRVNLGIRNRTTPRLAPGRYLRLIVRDKGIGISPEVVDRIFEPFFTTKGQGGTGLGLSVVDGIVREHHGGISVVSKVGVGTTFCVYLPEALGPEEVSRNTQEIPVRGDGQHIMYVDDEDALRGLMTRMLKSLGYTCTAFPDAQSALQAFRATPLQFDAVITDMSMPGISGAALASLLHSIRPEIPIALFSGESSDEGTADAVDIKIHLHKPASIQELGVALGKLLSG